MAGENTGLDLASQTGQEDIVEAIEGLSDSTSGLANQEGQADIQNAIEGLAMRLATALHGLVIKTTNVDIGSLNVVENGTYDASNDDNYDAYDEVVVNVPNSYDSTDEGKVVSNGSLVSQSSTTKSANGTYDTTLNNEVIVDVPNTFTALDNGKVVSSGSLISQTSRTVTATGTYDTTENNEVIVDIPSANGEGF